MVTDHGRRDEIGPIARTLEVLRANAQGMRQMQTQKQHAEAKATAARKSELTQLADKFQTATGHIVEAVNAASVKREGAGPQPCRHGRDRPASLLDGRHGLRREIARQVLDSSQIAGEAVKQAQSTDARIAELAHSASRIGDVVKLITAIAGQTNLLALNATDRLPA